MDLIRKEDLEKIFKHDKNAKAISKGAEVFDCPSCLDSFEFPIIPLEKILEGMKKEMLSLKDVLTAIKEYRGRSDG